MKCINMFWRSEYNHLNKKGEHCRHRKQISESFSSLKATPGNTWKFIALSLNVLQNLLKKVYHAHKHITLKLSRKVEKEGLLLN